MRSAASPTLLDELALAAWPAPVREPLDGWLLRFGYGVTGRANSVWPGGGGSLPVGEKIAAAEAFYERRGLSPRFQISPACVPAELDELLVARGYEAAPPVAVQVAPIRPLAETEAAVSTVVDEAWLEMWLSSRGFERGAALAAATAIFSAPGAFARFPAAGPPLAIGRAVAERDWVGIFAMQTVPQARRRGFAGQILTALLRWGAERGAEQAYLQVEESNAPALAFYEQYGFETLYSYRYRVRG